MTDILNGEIVGEIGAKLDEIEIELDASLDVASGRQKAPPL